MRKFVVNGQEYESKEPGFNFMCELEDKGIGTDDIDRKMLSFVREFFAYCSGLDSETAGDELQAHIVSGGGLSELFDVMNEAMESSGFFHAMQEKPKESKKARKTV